MTTFDRLRRIPGDWLARWRPVAPLFAAEIVVWIGFGALLPVLPLYFTEQGVDLATLGVVIAAWPAARLIGEPIFGWLADRVPRVPLMVAGLALSSVFLTLPLVLHGPAAFLVLRALDGLSTSIYDPAARGVLIDAMPAERHGEAFGWYGAAQMSGLLLGPALGGIGASLFGGIGFVFIMGGVLGLLGAVTVAVAVRDVPRRGHTPQAAAVGLAEFRRDLPPLEEGADPDGWARDGGSAPAGDGPRGDDPAADGLLGVTPPPGHGVDRPSSLRNRPLAAAILVNAGGNFGGGTYDVIWSIFLTAKGASLTLVSLTFSMFAIPVLLFGPLAGRIVDRRGSVRFLIVGSVMVGLSSLAYTLIVDPVWSIPIILVEATGFAILNPALYAIVGRGSPDGRSSTAQGVFGAAGTVGFVVASLVTGTLAGIDLRFPFYLFSAVIFTSLIGALLVGGRPLLASDSRRPGRRMGAEPGDPEVAAT
ncbi:MAG: MFS transporter [Chloroflexi bacterium]|nr:MFS transporter [Chloroflexota bacterium]